MKNIEQELREIESSSDLLDKALRLTGLVTRLFRTAGWELVVVGGSAVEFYTEGAYMSGDVDLCRRTLKPIPLRMAQDIMGRLGASGGPRSWKVAGLYVDLLGLIENEANSSYRTLETPCGPVSIVPAELVLVERTMLAFYPAPDAEARAVAKKMLAACLSGETPVDWTETRRLAALPAFGIADEMDKLKEEVRREIKLGT